MEEILYHLEPLNYCNSQDFRDLRWCRISSINSMTIIIGGWGQDPSSKSDATVSLKPRQFSAVLGGIYFVIAGLLLP